MPIICFFEGISILMYYRDHFPPHFHIEAGDESAIIGIDPIIIMEGNLSRRNRDKVLPGLRSTRPNCVQIGNLREDGNPLYGSHR